LLANEGIAYSDRIDYSLVKLNPTLDELFLVATELVPILREKIPGAGEITALRSGLGQNQLSELKYRDPLSPQSNAKSFLLGSKVSLSKGGTGLVHLAPNHGSEDYKLFRGTCNYRKESIVDHLGRLRLPEPFEPGRCSDCN